GLESRPRGVSTGPIEGGRPAATGDHRVLTPDRHRASASPRLCPGSVAAWPTRNVAIIVTQNRIGYATGGVTPTSGHAVTSGIATAHQRPDARREATRRKRNMAD